MRVRAGWARRFDVVVGLVLISLVLLVVPALRELRLAPAQAEVETPATPTPAAAEVAMDEVPEASEVRFTSNREPAATLAPTLEPAPTVEPAPAEATPLPIDGVSFENAPPPPLPAPTDQPAPAPTPPPVIVATAAPPAPPAAPARTPLVALPGETIYEDEYFAEVHKSGTFGSTIAIREVTVTASRLPAGSDFGQCPMENPPPGTQPVGYEVTVSWSDVYLDWVTIPLSVEASFWCSENEAAGLISGRPDRYWLFQYPGDTLQIVVSPNNTYLSYHWHWTD